VRCNGLNVYIPSDFICWNLSWKVMVLGRRTFERWWSHEDRTLINEIYCLYLRVPRELAHPFHHISKKVSPQQTLIFLVIKCWISQSHRNKFLLIICYPVFMCVCVCVCVVWQGEGKTGASTQDFRLAKQMLYHLNHSSSPSYWHIWQPNGSRHSILPVNPNN
jgi:hypothetical protein